ncbi:TPA: hypothetical protein L4S39_000438 [Pseudomonas aeruginosa]|nr:hypothetical protein [Pseudomonas aeruginosa]
MTNANECTCPSGDGSLRHPCPAHPASVELAGVAANLTFINGRPAMCGCQVEYSSGGGEYSDVIYVTLCAKHSGSAILDLVATNRIALTPEYEGQWHADLYLDREIPLAKAEGATPAEAVLALMSAERIDPEQESVGQAGGDERVIGWRERILAAHPNSDPGFWPDALLVEHMAAEIADLRAALAQPSPTLPPFAEKVLTKLRRFNECAEDPGSGGVDIGRHWLDLLTQLGPLNRVQRSPALWEISQQGEDLLGMPQPSPAQAEQAEAEAERPELWAVHAQGPDELYAAFTREDAEKHAAELNALPMPEGIAVGAVVVPSPWPEAEHWKYLAEQERDHKNEIAVRLRQFERICEGLPQDAIDGGWTVQGIRCYAKRLEDQLKVALARVADLEKQEPVATIAKVPGEDWNGLHFYRDLQGMQPGTKLYAAPVAQAQHLHDLDKQCRDDVARALGLRPNEERGFAWSYLLASIKSCVKAPEDTTQAQHGVPEGFREKFKQCMELAFAEIAYYVSPKKARDPNSRARKAGALATELHAMLAAAPGNSSQHSVPEGYALIPTRETEAMHDAVMALLYKGVARTDTQKLLDAYIAAVPGKEVGHE